MVFHTHNAIEVIHATGSFKTILGLNDILSNISDAKDDDNIKGIILNVNIVPSGISTLEEIREALLDFKESGKFILAHADSYSQGSPSIRTPLEHNLFPHFPRCGNRKPARMG